MAVSNQQILDFLKTNPDMSTTDIAKAMQTYSVTPAQLAQAVGQPTEAIQAEYNKVAPSTYTAGNVSKLADQILAQGTTKQWTGGLDATTSAKYMADELAKSGVTDIAQVGKSDSGIINTLTGQNLVSGYGERTGGNLWSGSYEGKGNTGFGVQFDAQEKPVFYTQGASSSDMGDLTPLLTIAAAAFGAPYLSSVIAGTTGLTGAALASATGAVTGGGISALTGGNVLKGALTGGAGGYLFGSLGAGSDAAQAAADADLAAGLDPTYGQNYDSVMKDLMAQSPGVADSIYGVNADYSLTFPSTPYETGLTPSDRANLDYMNGAQGINPNVIRPGLDTMGGATGLTLPNTPSTNLGNILTTTAGGSVLGSTLADVTTGAAGTGAVTTTGGTNTGGTTPGGTNVTPGTTGTAFPWTSLASSLYDMYAKNQMADKWQAQLDKVNQGIEGLYAPGSAEYQALWSDMSRKDAAAGRGSQYGVRAVDLAGKIAPIKTNAMVQSLQPMNTMMQNQMQNQYGGLNSLFYNMANTPGINTAINTGVSTAVNKGIDAIGNWISGG